MKKIFYPIALAIIAFSCKKPNAENPYLEPNNYVITKNKLLGGSDGDNGVAMVRNTDGSQVIVGSTYSTNGDFPTGIGTSGVIKVDANGNKIWSKKFGTGSDQFNGITKTADGGYVVVGFGAGNTGDFTGNHGAYDAWAIKIDDNGNKVWSKIFGGAMSDIFYKVANSDDGGFIITGITNSKDGDLSNINGTSNEGWVIKLDASGNKLWSKQFGGNGEDMFYNIIPSTNGFILMGETNSTTGDLSSNKGGTDGWVVKIDGNGNKIWSKNFGGSSYDYLSTGIITNDGNLILGGSSQSNDIDAIGGHGSSDSWIIKLDGSGNKIWSKVFGGTMWDEIYALCKTTDGNGVMTAGYSASTDGDLTGIGNHGVEDGWLLKLDNNGNKQFSKVIGGSGDDEFYAISPGTNGTYFICGYTESNNADLSSGGAHGNFDFWSLSIQAQ